FLQENGLDKDEIFVGGMSIGGNVALTLANQIAETSSCSLKGVFAIDSPLDLYSLYQGSDLDVANPDFDEERLAEPRWIIGTFQDSFGKGDSLLDNLQKVSPFVRAIESTSVPLLKDIPLRLYTEPDSTWWMEERNTSFSNTNAYALIQISESYKSQGWNQLELIKTEGKGFRASGERHPHSWSIVDVRELMSWLN
ncbi:MAG: hypothetical protein HRT74_11305, partial [Flavobacteriales bacterium]|nr:hypothetical protein [Flavobacteriales bacterium]